MSEFNHRVPCFDSVADLQGALSTKGGLCVTDLYPRDGTKKLGDLEARFAKLARVNPEDLVVCSSGMSAVVNTLEAVVSEGDTVACAWQTYTQTGVYIAEQLTSRGIKVVYFDSGSPNDIDRVVTANKPNVIFSETVSNGPDTPVLDTKRLLRTCDEQEINPYIILDNTLSLSTGYNLAPILAENPRVIGVESATKSYAFNSELAGIVYSKDEDFIAKLRQHRVTKGFGPNLSAIDRLIETLPRDTETFDRRNTRVFKASGALACSVAQALDDPAEFIVSHPLVPAHPNYEFAERELIDGSSPIFYIQCTGETDQFELAKKLWSNPEIREHCELGQSFGFDTTRILPNLTYPIVRIAAGAKTNSAELSAVFIDTLS